MAESTSSIHRVSPDVQIAYTLYQAQTKPESDPESPRPRPTTTIVLINGLADPKESWTTQIPAFTAAGYRVLTYDNRGVGASSRPSQTDEVYTTASMASDLASLLGGIDIKGPIHILGVSMGGMIAQSFTLEHLLLPLGTPTISDDVQVLSVTFACTYAAPGPFCTRLFELWRDVARDMSVATVLRDTLLWCFSPEYWADPARQGDIKAMDDDLKTMDDVGLGGMGQAAYLAQLNAILVFDSTDRLAELARLQQQQQQPKGSGTQIVVLAGESDILIPTSLSRELFGLIPSAIWRTARGGHACNWEFPDEFNKTCLDTWKEVEDRG